MADLATVKARPSEQGQASFRKDAFVRKQQTDLPGLEVNARISKGGDTGAAYLQQILGLATDAASSIGGAIGRATDKKNEQFGGQAALDATLGTKDETSYAKVEAYKKSYDFTNAKSGAIALDSTLTNSVTERLQDEDNPPTIDEINKMIDDGFHGYAMGEDGKVRNFGSPEAATAVAAQFAQTRARLVSGAQDIIKKQVDQKLLGGIVGNFIFDRKQAVTAPLPGISTTPIPASSVAPATSIADTTPTFKMAPDGFVASSNLRNLFGGLKGVKFTSLNRTKAHNAAVGGVATSQHIGANPDSSSAIDMVGVTPAQAKALLAERGLTGEVIHHDAGSGMHVHVESVKPLKGGTPTAAKPNGPQPTPAGAPGIDERAAPVDFEEIMKQVPPSVDKGVAKKYMLGALIQYADENGDSKLLDGLWQSTQKDGKTPSFGPDEIKLIRGERDRIQDKQRIEADRAVAKRHEDNAEILMSAEAQGNPASTETIRMWEREDRIPGAFANSLIHAREQEAKADLREQTAEAKEAARNADTEYDVDVMSEAELRRTGATRGASFEEDQARFARGEFGTGRRAVARLRQLRTAAIVGEKEALSNPEVAVMAERINNRWKPKKAGSGVLGTLQGATADTTDYRPGILSEFKRLVKSGEPSNLAYIAAVGKYGPKDNKDVRRANELRREELLRRARSGR